MISLLLADASGCELGTHSLIETFGLSKRYGALAALDDCTLGIRPGEVFGLLGPNGAGKTTLLRIILGYLRPTAGRASVDGLDCRRQSIEVRRLVAYLPGEARLFRTMRGHDALAVLAGLRAESAAQLARSIEIAQRLELDLSRRVALMSTGMRQKLALASTMASGTPIVILDEPTANLDPTVRRTVLSLVREAQAAGRTIVFSSHVLAETEEVCDRVAVLRAGRLVHTQTMKELRRRHRIALTTREPLPSPPESIRAELVQKSASNGEVVLETTGALQPLLGWLATLPIGEVRIEPLGLRGIYEEFHPSADS